MQITHAAARKLVQFDIDEDLNTQEEAVLATHLRDCLECRAYAEQIKELGSILVPVMKRQWNLQPTPLLLETIKAKTSLKIQPTVSLATRTIAVGVVFVTFIFSVWQFALSGEQVSRQVPGIIPPVPTPSTQSTSTKITLQNCTEVLYAVQKNDTLEKIAYQFSTSREEIMVANHLTTETINQTMELIIPVCNFTPTGTTDPTILTTTYTPPRNPIASTPGG